MTLFNANMIKNFPGSDDTRGTTTRINYSIPQPVSENVSPEMRPDEFLGEIGDALRYDNLTRNTISAIQVVTINDETNLNVWLTTNTLDHIKDAVLQLAEMIDLRVNDITTSLGGQVYNFTLTKLDILNSQINTAERGNGKVLITFNFDTIAYGQFTPNPLQQPNPAPQVCELYTGSSTLESGFFAPYGDTQANDTDPTLPQGQFKILIDAQIVAGVGCEFFLNTPLQANTIYNLYYSIPAYSFSGPGVGGFSIRFVMRIQGFIIRTFTLTKQIQNGYVQFTLPNSYQNATIDFEAVTQLANPNTAVKDFGGYMFFALANQYCGLS